MAFGQQLISSVFVLCIKICHKQGFNEIQRKAQYHIQCAVHFNRFHMLDNRAAIIVMQLISQKKKKRHIFHCMRFESN